MTGPLTAHDATLVDHLNYGDVGNSRRLLSVAEIQQVLRELRTRPAHIAAAVAAVDPSPDTRPGGRHRPARESEQVLTARRPSGVTAGARAHRPGGTRREVRAGGGDDAAGPREAGGDGAEPPAGCITVLAAHSGAGASTVALAISDAAADDDRPVHLIDAAHPARSGLVAAAAEELGTDVAGAWRHGRRSVVTIDRPALDDVPARWPDLPVGDSRVLAIVDLGLASPEDLALPAVDRVRSVVVCRPTVPGVRLTELLLGQLACQPVAVAAVGPDRWPGEVTASLGPRLRALRAAGRVVPVPLDRRLQVTGLTSSPLPKSVRSAGRLVLELLDVSHPGGNRPRSAAALDPAWTSEGTR